MFAMAPPYKLSKYFSYTASRDWFYRVTFANAGLRSVSSDLGDGTIMHSWVPRTQRSSKPNLLLLHGFGANATWQYGELLHHFSSLFNVYVPDLIFFGGSHTSRPERTESFQAQCVKKFMDLHNVDRVSLVGVSYGGFVGYSLAAQFPEAVESLVLCCTGVCLEEKDMVEGLFVVTDLEEAGHILLPQTPEKLRELMKLSFVNPVRGVPTIFLVDFIKTMCKDYVHEKNQLVQAILRDRKLSDLPKITQPTLIIWGEQDQVFPVALGQRLKRHIGASAQLVVIKEAGHAVNLEKTKEFTKHLKSFLIDQSSALNPQND